MWEAKGVNGELTRRSFKLVMVRRRTFRQLCFWKQSLEVGLYLLKLMYDLLPLRRSGSFRLAIFPGN